MNDVQPMWTPSQASIDAANLTRFIAQVNARHGLSIKGYDALYQWSLDQKEAFWSEIWDFCGIIGDKGERVLLDGDNIEAAQWFPDASLNFAENLLRKNSSEIAIYFRAEDQVDYSLTYQQLYEQVASVADWLKSKGLQPGERVAAYLPNMPEAVVAMLAATSLGAVWTSTSPDFGEDSVVDRFGQTEPKFLFTVDGYFYNGKRHEITDKIKIICNQVPSIEAVIQIDFAGFGNHINAVDWKEIIANPVTLIEFVPRKFNDPLYVLYSSGTTGKPKCITDRKSVV
jgi:acetoacetyl-CoA synthetase